MAVLEEGSDLTRVIPIEIHVASWPQKEFLSGSILENLPPGSPVKLRPSASGWIIPKDGILQSSAIFELRNGVVITNQPLDREKQAQYELKVISKKNFNQVLATLDIQVLDVNDNLPVFNVTSTKILWKINPYGMRKYSILGKELLNSTEVETPI